MECLKLILIDEHSTVLKGGKPPRFEGGCSVQETSSQDQDVQRSEESVGTSNQISDRKMKL